MTGYRHVRFIGSISKLAMCIVIITTAFSAHIAVSATAWNKAWVESRAGGSVIEIPSFLADGERRGLFMDGEEYGTAYDGSDLSSLMLQQWFVTTEETPAGFLRNSTAGKMKTVTYSADRKTWAALSGYEDASGKKGYYAICSARGSILVCVRMFWNTSEQQFVAPLVERIVRSFRKNN